MKEKGDLRKGVGLLAAFGLWTPLLLTVDVRAAGPEGTTIGLAAFNVWGAAVFVAHRLCTMNPDYEVIRYPRSIEVRYMLDSIDDTSEDNSTAKKIADDVCHDAKGVWHFITDIFKR